MRYSSIKLYAILGLLLFGTGEALCSDKFSLNPSLSISEEFNDNVFSVRHNKTTDFITHLMPRVALKYNASFWDWDLSYLLDYRYFARHSSTYELAHNLSATGNMRIVKDLLFMDVTDTYRRVSLDVNRDTTRDSLNVNQANQNILTLAPYIAFRPRPTVQVRTGYHYMNEMYIDSAAVEREEHGAFATLIGDLSRGATMTMNLNYNYVTTGQGVISTQGTTNPTITYHLFTPSLGIRYEYADRSFVSIEGGYSWFFYGGAPDASSPYWNAGITHTFDFLTATFNTRTRYNTDPLRTSTIERDYTGRLEKTLKRGSVGFSASYFENLDSQTDSILSKRITFSGNARHELTNKVIGSLDITAEKVDDISNLDINNDTTAPYRFAVGTDISYSMTRDIVVSINYNYITYRQSIDSAENNIEINRVMLAVSKAF